MRREELYLHDIIEALDHIAGFIESLDASTFEQSELVRSAVVQKLTVVGEAAARISDELKKRHLEIPWPQIVAFRNILVHAYFGVDWTEVWQAVTRQAPELRKQIAAILEAEVDRPDHAT